MSRRNGDVAAAAEQQLTLNVESSLREELPISGTLRISGALRVEQDLNKDQVVLVTVSTLDESGDIVAGEVLARALAGVGEVGFKTVRTETGAYVERKHSAKVAQG